MEHWSSLKSCFVSHEKSSKQCKHIHLQTPPTRGSIIQDPKTSLQLFVGLFRCAYFLVYQIYSHENDHLDNLGLFEFLWTKLTRNYKIRLLKNYKNIGLQWFICKTLINLCMACIFKGIASKGITTVLSFEWLGKVLTKCTFRVTYPLYRFFYI